MLRSLFLVALCCSGCSVKWQIAQPEPGMTEEQKKAIQANFQRQDAILSEIVKKVIELRKEHGFLPGGGL